MEDSQMNIQKNETALTLSSSDYNTVANKWHTFQVPFESRSLI